MADSAGASMEGVSPGSRARRRSIVPPSLRRSIGVFVFLLVLEYLVLPQLAGARKSLHLLAQVNLGWVAAGVALEAAALVAYAELTRSVLPQSESGPTLFTLLRIDLSTLAVSHVLPGGSAAGTSLGYRLLTEAGVSGTDAGFAMAMQGIGSAVLLNALLWIGLVVSLRARGFNPLYETAAIAGILLLAAFGALVLLLTRGEEHAARILRAVARHVPLLNEDAVDRLVRRLAERLRELTSDRRLLLGAVAWGAANWLLDAASLWLFLLAFGQHVPPDALLVSYGLANVLAAIPVTPGGLGIVEGVLVSALVGFGSARGVAILGVIAWRLVNFWLPIPAGGLAYLSLKVEPGAPAERKAAELEHLARQSAKEASRPLPLRPRRRKR